MGIEKLQKTAQAAGLAMGTAEDDFSPKANPAPAEAWRYAGPRSAPAQNISTDRISQSPKTAQPAKSTVPASKTIASNGIWGLSFWSYLTGRATA